ncbi:MAG TPA: hypothetical protein VEW42_01845 [Candidatus Eisenbacteria bacterium]|nr:hypothetical protein [Candidatus Eisenbacteria bacterium]
MSGKPRENSSWWEPGDTFVPQGYKPVPPGVRAAPDGVHQGWTVVPENHPDARMAVSNKTYKRWARGQQR